MNFSDLRNLDFTNMGSWPALAKAIAVIVIVAAIGGAGYWFLTRHQLEELTQAERVEQELRGEFARKQQVMANLDAYRAQIEQMQVSLDKLIKQLPTSTEMPDLIDNISNTGKRNGLEFALFQPQAEQRQEFYAAKPIAIKARATYHQFGAFVSSISALSRIVTLEKASLTDTDSRVQTGGDNKPLVIEATLQTYRYLEDGDAESAEVQGSAEN
jgi:type IV pilus assembly protein PilO